MDITYYWSSLANNANISFNPDEDQLIFDADIDSYMQLSNWDFQAGFSTFTDLSGKTVTFTGLSTFKITPINVQFAGSDARFFIGDLSTGTAGDDLPNTITGTAGHDVIFGFGGNDTLNGGDGDDLIYAAGGGNDLVNGGNGFDWYMATTGTPFGITANLYTGKVYYYDDGEVDTLTSIEGVRGTMHDDVLIGNQFNNMFRGRAGDDFILGGGGIDWALYNEANATMGVVINLENGQVTNDGYGSADVLSDVENIRGGRFDDFIQGDENGNFLRGDAGNDTLVGGGEADILWGGLGDDVLHGGFADGSSEGGEGYYGGSIAINTASYTDANGGVTVDLNLTGPQNTTSAGFDTLVNIQDLWGSQFDDVLAGNAQNNFLQGNNGNDTLIGNAGNDYLTGGAGNDSLNGGAGNDVLEGGAGNDTLVGGGGSDTAIYSDAQSAITIDLALTTAQNTGGAGIDTLSSVENAEGSGFNDMIKGNTSANALMGGAGRDTLNGSSGNDSLYGGAGNDSLIGGTGNDWLQGGTGNDTLNGGSGTDTADYSDATSGVVVDLSITGAQNTVGRGTDLLISIESLAGSNHADRLTGDAGNNTLKGGEGSDTLVGGAGDDHLDGGSDYQWDPVTGQSSYGAGDTVDYSGATSGITVDLYNTWGAQDIGGGQGWDTLNSIEHVIGSQYNDVLRSSRYLDSWEGSLLAGAGNDTVVFQHDGQTTYWSDGVNEQYYERVTHTLNGGSGVDTLVLSEYFNGYQGMLLDLSSTAEQVYENVTTYTDVDGTIDTYVYGGSVFVRGFENVVGSNGNDHIIGTSGNNTIEGAQGNDTLEGGSGVDTLSYANLGNRDVPWEYDFNTGSYVFPGVSVSLAITTEQNTGYWGIDTVSGFENLIGSAGNDDLRGNSGNNVIEGGEGNDTIRGGSGLDTASYTSATWGVAVDLSITASQNTGAAGWDTLMSIERLVGSNFADTLSGNSGANTLNGGLGSDTLTGGSGADVFVYRSIEESGAGLSIDTITDFNSAQDVIDLSSIDADSTVSGNQAFSFIGSGSFSTAGQVRFENGMVYADIDGDSIADLQISLMGVSALSASDFVL